MLKNKFVYGFKMLLWIVVLFSSGIIYGFMYYESVPNHTQMSEVIVEKLPFPVTTVKKVVRTRLDSETGKTYKAPIEVMPFNEFMVFAKDKKLVYLITKVKLHLQSATFTYYVDAPENVIKTTYDIATTDTYKGKYFDFEYRPTRIIFKEKAVIVVTELKPKIWIPISFAIIFVVMALLVIPLKPKYSSQ